MEIKPGHLYAAFPASTVFILYYFYFILSSLRYHHLIGNSYTQGTQEDSSVSTGNVLLLRLPRCYTGGPSSEERGRMSGFRSKSAEEPFCLLSPLPLLALWLSSWRDLT